MRWPRLAAALVAWILGWSAAADAAAQSPTCTADPFAGRGLYLRGTPTQWAADETFRFAWVCNRHELVVDLQGEHSFKVGDNGWSADADFGAGAAGPALQLRGGNITRRFDGATRLVLQFDAERRAALSEQACAAAPFGTTRLYLRGGFTSWGAHEEFALRWRCDAYVVNVALSGRQEFKIGDADWRPETTFGARADGSATRGGDNLTRDFSGEQSLALRLDVQRNPQVVLGPRLFHDNAIRAVSDPVALALSFNSRAHDDKAPFGAVTAGTAVLWGFTAPAGGVEAATLVIETRLLEGNQDRLEYTPLVRLPMNRSGASTGRERWSASHRFINPAVYGYWFEVRIGSATYVLQNNADNVPWTRERGSGGPGAVVAMPAESKFVRRFRQTVYDPAFKLPAWASDIVYYMIFPERFRNGDPRNDPDPARDRYRRYGIEKHTNWLAKPYRPGTGDGSDEAYNNDFFGGDLAGITARLGMLRELGINTLYMTPIFQAPSNHKYDTADYQRIDPAFGTTADFVRLTRDAARRGIRVIPDTSLNHVGSDSPYFDRYARFPQQGAFEGGKPNPASPYASWFRFDTTQTEPDRMYRGWGGPDLPELDKASPAFRAYAYGDPDSVTRRWLKLGAAGWRMDVAPWVPDDFWREWRKAVKQTKPDALTVAEAWFDSSKYFVGDMFDSTMNYIFRNAVLDHANGGSAKTLVANLEHLREAYPPQVHQALMNLLSSHDVPRALHEFGWTQTAADKPGAEVLAKQRLKFATFIQMTQPGAPLVYYGDEVGVAGGADPFNRATYPWPELGGKPDLVLRAEFKRLIQLRQRHAVLRRGESFKPLFVDDSVAVFARRLGRQWALVASHNGAQARSVSVELPAAAPSRYVDALGGRAVAAQGGRITIELPALGGSVLVGRAGERGR